MSDEILDGKWHLQELLAVGWSDDMAARFPDTNHTLCRCEFDEHGKFVRCAGWHCNRCGSHTNSFGHHSCPDRPDPAGEAS